MKIYIKYENTQLIETNNFSSINSIINKYIHDNKLDSSYCNSDDFYVDYNGNYLNRNYSLEKYDITDGNTIQLHKVVKGGSNFFSFATKNYFLVFIVFVLAFVPVIILPLGLIPSIGNLIKVIIDKSTDKVGKYLVCVLGKKTLFKRFKFFIYLIKYIIFILIIYIVITFPLVLLCVTLKGHSIFDDPKSICGGLNMGKSAGTMLTMVYVGIFLAMRSAKLIFGPIIFILKKNYYTNMFFNPIFKFLLRIFESIKYIPITALFPFNLFFNPYFVFLTSLIPAIKIFLDMISKLGCTKIPSGLMSELKKQMLSLKSSITTTDKCCKKDGEKEDELEFGIALGLDKEAEEKIQENKMKALFERDQEEMCKEKNNNPCCSPSNYMFIADGLKMLIENQSSSNLLKASNLFPNFVLFTEALYESAQLVLNDGVEDIMEKPLNEKKIYLRKVRENKSNVLNPSTKNLIDTFLKGNSDDGAFEIKKALDKNIPHENKLIDEINFKLNFLNDEMISYAKEDGSQYIPGKSPLKTVFKFVFMDLFCNVSSSANSSLDIIYKMGEVEEIVDMLKSGATSGLFTSICYLLTVIVLIIMGIFGFF
jgi:hypothetical protein